MSLSDFLPLLSLSHSFLLFLFHFFSLTLSLLSRFLFASISKLTFLLYSQYSTSFPDCLNVSICTGKYHQGKGNTLITHTKTSYSIVSLVFRKFLCGTYRNGLNRGTSKLRHSEYLKKYGLY